MFNRAPFNRAPFNRSLITLFGGALVELQGQISTYIDLLGTQNYYDSLLGKLEEQIALQGNIINVYQLMGNTVSTMLQGQIDHLLTLLGQYLSEENLDG